MIFEKELPDAVLHFRMPQPCVDGRGHTQSMCNASGDILRGHWIARQRSVSYVTDVLPNQHRRS